MSDNQTIKGVRSGIELFPQFVYLPKARTNYGIFNIRFQGPKVWNSIEEQIKSSSLKLFKEKLKNNFLCKY